MKKRERTGRGERGREKEWKRGKKRGSTREWKRGVIIHVVADILIHCI